ncbi:MAG TPA: alkaline phosphatase family protein [Vicinamibacterales bacterium]|nr:alkaline phosphatase family protein [Vicinamibacterales bacterium]
MRRRWTAAALACGLAVGWTACARPAPPARQKLVILGFDGLDPTLLDLYLERGEMPAFASLIKAGTLGRLETTVSPESPTSWASFATGVNPGKHNIYDFLVRDLQTYIPDLGIVHTQPPTFLFNWMPLSRPKITSIRGGTSFWVTAGQAGVRSEVLTVPVTFPPEDVPDGELLAGLPTPDVRGTIGTYSYWATDLSRYEEGNSEMAGDLKHLTFESGVAHTKLTGPPNPIIKKKVKEIFGKGKLSDADRTAVAELQVNEDASLPLDIAWTRGSGQATLSVAGQSFTLKAGEWSTWINVDFTINVFIRVHGMLLFYLEQADNELRLYASPINFRPDEPPVPLSAPSGLAADLYKRLGPFRTLGWAEATNPLREERIDEQAFMDDLMRAFDDRAKVILDRLGGNDWDLLVGVIESTDRVQHMMFRLLDPAHPAYNADLAAKFGDSIERVYKRADQFVGQVMDAAPPGATIMIVSDHGFHAWRKAVNLNTWLVQQGYMTIKGNEPSKDKKLSDLFGGGEYWENVDWSRTKAYSMGLGQIYINMRGREGQGIVSPGAEASALADEIKGKLLAFVDPDDYHRIVRNVYKRDDVYSGEFLGNAPDLQVGFEDGYRVSWQTTLGGSPQGLVYPNTQKWSGDHCGFDYQTTAGVFVSSKPITRSSPRIIDIAPTVLKFFGVAIPGTIDGKPLF